MNETMTGREALVAAIRDGIRHQIRVLREHDASAQEYRRKASLYAQAGHYELAGQVYGYAHADADVAERAAAYLVKAGAS